MKIKIISQVKKNFRDYRIIEKFTVGIVLNGSEIKSLRTHQSSIDEAYILPHHHELYIINMYIKTYSYSQKTNYDEKRRRKILLRKREIKKIIKQLKSKNYSLVPLLLFINERGWAKLEIALAQRLRKYQIKNKVKEREAQRELRGKEW